MAELKKCPCCGGSNLRTKCEESMSGKMSLSTVQCMGCGLLMDSDVDGRPVGEKWNTRADDWISVDTEKPPVETDIYMGLWITVTLGGEARRSFRYFKVTICDDGDILDEALEPFDYCPIEALTHWHHILEPPKGAGE